MNVIITRSVSSSCFKNSCIECTMIWMLLIPSPWVSQFHPSQRRWVTKWKVWQFSKWNTVPWVCIWIPLTMVAWSLSLWLLMSSSRAMQEINSQESPCSTFPVKEQRLTVNLKECLPGPVCVGCPRELSKHALLNSLRVDVMKKLGSWKQALVAQIVREQVAWNKFPYTMPGFYRHLGDAFCRLSRPFSPVKGLLLLSHLSRPLCVTP